MALDTLRLPRVPEPDEIAAWLARLPHRVGAYLIASSRQALWAILVWTAFLRLLHLDLVPLGIAQARWLTQASAYLSGDPDALGIGWFARLLALPLRLSMNPAVVAGAFTVVALIALLLVFETTSGTQGWRVAVLFTALFAANPWGMVLTRLVDPAAVAVVLALCLLLGLQALLLKRRAWAGTLVGACTTLLAVLSPDGLATTVAVSVLLLVYVRRVHWPQVILGTLLALLLALPSLYYAADGIWAGWAAFFRTLADPHPLVEAAPFEAYRMLLSGEGIARLIDVQPGQAAVWRGLRGLAIAWGWVCLLCLPGAGWLGLRAWARWREGDDPVRHAVPVVWVGVALLLYALRGRDVGVKQLAALLPAGLLMVSLVASALISRLRVPRHAAVVLWAVVALTLMVGGYAGLALNVQSRDGYAREAYGTPLREWRRLATLVLRAPATPGAALWVVSPGIDPEHDEYPAVLGYLVRGQASPLFVRREDEPALLYPVEREAAYVLIGKAPVQQHIIDSWRADETALVTGTGNETSARLLESPSHPVEILLGTIPTRDWAAWDTGLRLVGYDGPVLSDDCRTLTLATYWTFENIPASERTARHVLSVTLYDRDGVPVTARSTFGLAEGQWKEGLLLEQWHVLTLPSGAPPEPYEIHLTVDRVHDGYRHLVIDDAGRACDDRKVLGPFMTVAP